MTVGSVLKTTYLQTISDKSFRYTKNKTVISERYNRNNRRFKEIRDS